ncbi:MAG: hypothetical protein EOP83_09415 [Verrucomicrobiaceae bacterium]|nr:MAG: hypothetical protein EOP83_09415 [Verrucomicrobiaceae bacterium]
MRLFVEVGRVLERTGTTAFVRNNLPDAFGRAVELVFDSEADAVAFRLAFTMTCYRALHEATRKDHSAAVTQK